MESELREAIDARPADPALRRALAESWGGRPEAELVRLLLEKPKAPSGDAIRRWFEVHVGWPSWPSREESARFRFVSKYAADGWLQGAFDPARWPDRGRWHAGVVALARRRLLNAREWAPGDDRLREPLAKLTALAARTPPDPDESAPTGPTGRHFTADHRAAMSAIYEGQTVAALMYDLPGTDPGSGSHFEEVEQFHVLGWSWLGLPPLRPESPSEAPWHEAAPRRDRLPPLPRGLERFLLRWVVRWFRRD